MNRIAMTRLGWAGLLVVCLASSSQAQDADEAAEQRKGEEAADAQQPPMGGQMPEMRDMAVAMQSMAETCQTMMQREMQYYPLRIAALAVVGGLLALALLLFVVLEFQWIRYFNLRIKTEKRALSR